MHHIVSPPCFYHLLLPPFLPCLPFLPFSPFYPFLPFLPFRSGVAPACQVAAWAVTSLVIGINLFLLLDFAQTHLPPTLPIHIALSAVAVAYLTFTAYLAVGPTTAERMWETVFRR